MLVLMKTDKKRDKNKIRILQEFKRKYRQLTSKYSPQINALVNRFYSESSSIDSKINHAIGLEEEYDRFLEDFSNLEIPSFLDFAYSCELDHLNREKEFYNGFPNFLNHNLLNIISSKSETSNMNFLRELNKLDKNLQLII